MFSRVGAVLIYLYSDIINPVLEIENLVGYEWDGFSKFMLEVVGQYNLLPYA